MAQVGASLRDPAGFVVQEKGEFYRIVQPVYQANYRILFDSGLYEALTREGLLIEHEEALPLENYATAWKTIKPRQLSFISYPWEWCFSQYKDAALATLRIQKIALGHGMSLKDASAYNIQFVDGKPLLIDSLSFEKIPEDRPWVAYQQFCKHFLAPLALMSCTDVRMGQMMRLFLDGIPIDLASKLLPKRTRLKLWLLVHIHMHAKSQKKHAGEKVTGVQRKYSVNALRGLVESLTSSVKSLDWQPPKNVWGDYYQNKVTGGYYVQHKQETVTAYIERVNPKTMWDLGANTGAFSRIGSSRGIKTYSFDGDPDCVELNYLEAKKTLDKNICPLFMDLSNPSPDLGWMNSEKTAWLNRPKPNLTLALALIHHLCIGNNIPLERLAEFFSKVSKWLVIEFVPKEDPNAQKLLHAREDIFDKYHRGEFEAAFGRAFETEAVTKLQNSDRILYLMKRKGAS